MEELFLFFSLLTARKGKETRDVDVSVLDSASNQQVLDDCYICRLFAEMDE